MSNDIARRANRIIIGCAVVGLLAMFGAGVSAMLGNYLLAIINVAVVIGNIGLIASNLHLRSGLR